MAVIKYPFVVWHGYANSSALSEGAELSRDDFRTLKAAQAHAQTITLLAGDKVEIIELIADA
jgi:hypothetical protein